MGGARRSPGGGGAPRSEAYAPQEEYDSYAGAAAVEMGATGMDMDQLEETLTGLFVEADVDGSGSLDHGEFRSLMETADFGLKPREVELLIAEADENSDGQVTYKEFVPLALQVIQTIRLKERVKDDEMMAADYYREAAQQIIGMKPRDVEALTTKAADQNGMLSRT